MGGLSDFGIPRREADNAPAALDHEFECGDTSNGANGGPSRHA